MMQFYATQNTEKNWNFKSHCSSFFLYPSNTIDRAFTVSGKSMLCCEVIMRRALMH